MQKQSARIKCKNNLIKPMRSIKTQADNPVGLRPHDVSYCLTRPQTCRVVCPCSKQPRTIKTLIYNDIFQIFKVQKKFEVRLNSSRNCSVWFVASLLEIYPLLH